MKFLLTPVIVFTIWLVSGCHTYNYCGSYVGQSFNYDEKTHKFCKGLVEYQVKLDSDSIAKFTERISLYSEFGKATWHDYPNYILLDFKEYGSEEEWPWYMKKIAGVKYERCCIRLEKKRKNLQLNKSILKKSK
ncbi:MAG: hypothetical protein K2L22_11680 [Muribaculaceae bacterium]|nr:hypothetical protein [Muribaculaceae bacterium]